MRDVKPEINTTSSYATQKKRLLAKAQSESLFGNNTMKQEPGLNEQSGVSRDIEKAGSSNANKG